MTINRNPGISFSQLTKRYGTVTALDGFSADIEPGRITAFLGANGSGKTTSMRVLLGLATPASGTALIGGRRYAELEHPLRTVGAVLESGFAPNRSARNHVRITASQAGVPQSRVDEVLELVGLTDAANRRVGGFSLGMRQRLALASALIGDPAVLVLDEPFNGLDPAGIQTMRGFLRRFADGGGTVLLSSHLLAEVAHSADAAVIIDHGRLVSAGPIDSLVPKSAGTSVTTSDSFRLAAALTGRGAHLEPVSAEQMTVTGIAPEVIARTAMEAGVVILGMRAAGDDLEAVFQSLIMQGEGGMTKLIRLEFLKLTDDSRALRDGGRGTAAEHGLGSYQRSHQTRRGDPALGSPENVHHVLGQASAVTSMAMFVLGVLIVAGEYRQRTISATFLAEPRRLRVITAKLLTAAVSGRCWPPSPMQRQRRRRSRLYAGKGIHTLPVNVTSLGLGTVISGAAYGLLGAALGALTRNTVAAILSGLIWIQLFEVAILENAVPSLAKWLPAGAHKG